VNEANERLSSSTDPNVLQVIRAAQQELSGLMQQRTEIMRRIGTTKQTLIGLARLFGDAALQQELVDFMDERTTPRQPGFTRACRLVLMEAKRPLNSREMCERLWQRHRDLALRHKDLLASVTTVLNRLVRYGEAKAIEDNGRRIWTWVASPKDEGVQPNGISERLQTGNPVSNLPNLEVSRGPKTSGATDAA
jgi:hypothetical protein